MKQLIIIFIFFALTACSTNKSIILNDSLTDPIAEVELAKISLNNFLSFLNLGQFDQAVSYYGGDWNYLEKLNPEINTNFKERLLERYCHKNNGLCLKPKIVSQLQVSGGLYKFSVQFYNADNSIYRTFGCPCNGGGKSEFEFNVKKITDNQFLTLNLPPQDLGN